MKKNQIDKAPNHSWVNNQQGFSLIEVVIAIAILAIGMLAAATMQINAVRNTTSGNIFTEANMLAKATMEQLKNTQELTDLDGGGANNGITADGQPGGIYNVSWVVAEVGDTARRITLTVQWNRQGGSQQISIESITRGGGV